ncbi:probable serine/threonine-protein kinase samkA isoform X2 [Monomorium pharaonis]|uniref:probable serine/threonine-protein kinase samkA isoform X2 n=1 Tax=Monomorium pharaonis TaxID=307658 RepID=UPI00063F0B91|nr:probable serine/threonine-protein kinase samkA isoform X2 [Monomorium pharaonis]
MYGLYENKKKYFVQTPNTRNVNKLIAQSDDNEMLNRIAKNLNLRIPVVQVNKNIVNISTFKSECIFDVTHNFQTFSENMNDNIDEFMMIDEKHIIDEIIEIRNESISNNTNDNSIDNTELHEDINKDSEKLHSHKNNYNNDDVDMVDSCYNADSESSEEESDVQSKKSNTNIQKSSKTSLNVNKKKICDDIHLRVQCSKPKGRGKRNFCFYCKKMMTKISRHYETIHKDEEDVKKFISLPKVLREDDIIRLIRYDELVITYGNKMCLKRDTNQHQHQERIRTRLRLLGRFLQALRKINKDVTDFYSLYHPSKYDNCITAVNQLAGFNENTKLYAASSVASTLCAYIREMGNLGIAEHIKRNKLKEKINIEDFLQLFQGFSVSVQKNVKKSRIQARRNKKTQELSFDDIKVLHDFLQSNRRKAFQQLKNIFTFNTWRQLAEFTLISVQVFNRRCAEAVERMSIDDYMHQGCINKRTNSDIYESLLHETRKTVDNYVRVPIRERCGKPVAILLDCEMKNCIEVLLRYRKEANIHEKNPYIFALPGDDKRRFKACDIITQILPTMQRTCSSDNETS